MSATHPIDFTTTSAPVLYVAFELGWTSWKLAFTVGAAQKPRLRSIPARDVDTLMREIRDAKRRFHLPETTPVISCYEAGRDGFWLNRFLASKKIGNLIVDSASIEVNRRRRRPSPTASTLPSWSACSFVGTTEGHPRTGIAGKFIRLNQGHPRTGIAGKFIRLNQGHPRTGSACKLIRLNPQPIRIKTIPAPTQLLRRVARVYSMRSQ